VKARKGLLGAVAVLALAVAVLVLWPRPDRVTLAT
jgi:hypothetical protein